jgi:hypothetical protein
MPSSMCRHARYHVYNLINLTFFHSEVVTDTTRVLPATATSVPRQRPQQKQRAFDARAINITTQSQDRILSDTLQQTHHKLSTNELEVF